MRITLRNLSLEMIERCPEIRTWLNQFRDEDRVTAKNLLMKLNFVTRDTYSEWLKSTLSGLTKTPCALYAVRKFNDDEVHCLWDSAGEVVKRPITSLGSEDLVRSVISSLIKSDSQRFLDHPSLKTVQHRKVHEVVLIDDSIGSGKRVVDYIKVMMTNRTLMSWWSFGWICFHIVAFARTIEATSMIIEKTPGSDHPVRKYPKSQKIAVSSPLVYQTSHLETRWGSRFQKIVDVCKSQKAIPANLRLGFRGTMANVVFYHSVPNNIPGVLWYECEKWAPLFPRRSVPEWLPSLLEGSPAPRQSDGKISETLLAVLLLIKRGIRNQSTLARALGVDVTFVLQLLAGGQDSGFLTVSNRLTKTGVQVIRATKQGSEIDQFDRSLYVPKKWRVDRATTQPSGPAG